MTEAVQRIEGIAAPLEIANLDTDQIMPKQFLHGIDKAGLDKGLLWDHRFDVMQGLDMIGASLSHKAEIEAFASRHWASHPWLKDVAGRTKARLDAQSPV